MIIKLTKDMIVSQDDNWEMIVVYEGEEHYLYIPNKNGIEPTMEEWEKEFNKSLKMFRVSIEIRKKTKRWFGG